MNKTEISREKLVELAVKAGFEQHYHRLIARDGYDGWITWEGGECPVSFDTEVQVILRNGTISPPIEAGDFCWDINDDDDDITAYRVIEENHD